MRRLTQFRSALNAAGDAPTREDLEQLLALARSLHLRDDEIDEELAQIHASLDALTLAERLAAGDLPRVPASAIAPDDTCRFAAPARFGRRRADQLGQVLLTDGWLKFRGMLDVSVAWSEVSHVERAGDEIILMLANSRRMLRFSFRTPGDAACAGVLAQYLAAGARAASAEPPTDLYGHRLHAS
jgi:hypothetical protein